MIRVGYNSLLYRMRKRFGLFYPLVMGFVRLGVIFVAGVLMYRVVEGWNLLDSFYMVVLSLSTVGFQEVHPLSDRGKLLTSLLILVGVGNFGYLVGTFSQILVEGRLQNFWEKRRLKKTIDALSDHFIVCGYGRIGSIVAKEITHEGEAVVVIEKDPAARERLEADGILYLDGDATMDTVLVAAGLHRARTLITTLTQDAANVYVTLTARQLKPDIQIVARAESEAHIPRLERAGANRVFLPYTVGGMRMAQTVLRPTVMDFLDLAVRGSNLELQMEELTVTPKSSIKGLDLVSARIRPRFNLIVIAIKKASGEMIFNPGPDAVLDVLDTMIAVGKKEDLQKLQAIL